MWGNYEQSNSIAGSGRVAIASATASKLALDCKFLDFSADRSATRDFLAIIINNRCSKFQSDGKLRSLNPIIDRHTDRGTEELPQIFGEGAGAEDLGVEYLRKFSDRDWLQLQSYWQTQSDFWIEALIHLLVDLDSGKARDLLAIVAGAGSYESRLTAMDYVRNFERTLSPESLAQLKNNPVIYNQRGN